MWNELNEAETKREEWNEREQALIDAGCSVVTYQELKRGPAPDGHHADSFHWTEPEYNFQLDMVAYSDYAGSSVDIANQRYMQSDTSYGDLLDERGGGYGTVWLVISRSNLAAMSEDTFEEMIEDITTITDSYPILDEGVWSEVEQELIEENFDSWAARDFYSEIFNILHNTEGYDDIAEKWDEFVPSDAEDMADLFYKAVKGSGQWWENEIGTSMHIDTDRLAQYAVENNLSGIIKKISEYTSK